jgi:hypothetical protein
LNTGITPESTIALSPQQGIHKRKKCHIQAWWHMPVIPALRRLRQEDCTVRASLGCILRHCLKNKTKQNKNQQPTVAEQRKI